MIRTAFLAAAFCLPLIAASFSGEVAYAHVKTQCDMGPRHYGSTSYFSLRSYITNTLSKAGLAPKTHAFRSPYFPDRRGENYFAVIPGAGAKYIICAAHYDTRSIAEKELLLSKRGPIAGANDGASAVGVLLELARVLPGKKLPYPVMLVFFDMEDDGSFARSFTDTDWIQGSLAFAARSDMTKAKVHCGILLDMIGSDKAVYRYESYAYSRYSSLYAAVWDMARAMGYSQFVKGSSGEIIDDHIPFAVKGIPFIDIIDMGYAWHHTQGDTLDKISKEALYRTGSLIERFVQSPPAW